MKQVPLNSGTVLDNFYCTYMNYEIMRCNVSHERCQFKAHEITHVIKFLTRNSKQAAKI